MRDTIEAAKLDSIEAVYRLAASLNNNRVRDKQAANPVSSRPTHQITQQSNNNRGKKRKQSNPVCNAIVPLVNPNPVAPVDAPKPYTGIHPKCATCNFHHPANARCRRCENCNRYGHTINFCRQQGQQAQPAPPAQQAQQALPAPPNARPAGACFKCGDVNHLRPQCP
ncbi:putative transcription factor interactor and regulator CCHC(Zn) family [Helianthus anomalus]